MKRRIFFLGFSVLGLCFLVLGGNKVEAVNQTVTINRFLTKIYSENKQEAISIRNATVRILCYDKEGKRHILRNNLISDNVGEINDIAVNVPNNINRIYFEYELSRPKVGKIVNSKGNIYRPITGMDIPENYTIDTTLVRSFLNSGVYSDREYNYQSVKIWNRYYDLVSETKDSVQTALEAFPEFKSTFDYSFKPITVLYEYNYQKTKGAAFTSSNPSFGEVRKKQGLISIPYISEMNTYDRLQQNEFYDINLAHEWGHWTMHQAIGKLVGGSYNGHTGYNESEALSYKEGWALFQANRYPYGYNWNWKLDNSIQRSIGDYAKCYGKSTNWTVNSIFFDIYDIESPREPEDQYDIAKAWMPEVINADLEYRQRLSTGLLFIFMVNSKAKTFSEYVSYMRENDLIKDETSFNKILQLNGLDLKGRFMLDNKGNKIIYR